MNYYTKDKRHNLRLPKKKMGFMFIPKDVAGTTFNKTDSHLKVTCMGTLS